MSIRQGLQDLIQTDAPINQGNSGGALIDTQGKVGYTGEYALGEDFSILPRSLWFSVKSEYCFPSADRWPEQTLSDQEIR